MRDKDQQWLHLSRQVGDQVCGGGVVKREQVTGRGQVKHYGRDGDVGQVVYVFLHAGPETVHFVEFVFILLGGRGV